MSMSLPAPLSDVIWSLLLTADHPSREQTAGSEMTWIAGSQYQVIQQLNTLSAQLQGWAKSASRLAAKKYVNFI